MKLPKASRGNQGQFVPQDFAQVIAHLPEECPLIGGQAVAWWAQQHGLQAEAPVTSQDIDFWGSRADLIRLAKAMDRKAVFPHEYEMPVWVGAIPLQINDQESLAEFLHAVPGLFVFRAIIHNDRPIVNGQDAGIRTRTVRFTGGDAAVTPRS